VARRILITGMSGTGKSSVIAEMARCGFQAIDLDTPAWSHWVDADPQDILTPAAGKDWVWREDRVCALLSAAEPELLFVSGCAENMGKLFGLIDRSILLSAPVETIMDRLSARSSKGYGHTAEERSKVAELIATVEPLLRQAAHWEIDTSRSVEDTVAEIIARVLR
jgi:shikimate kinase